MESKKSEPWKAPAVCSLLAFLCLFFLTALLTNNPPYSVDITTVRTTVVTFITSQHSSANPAHRYQIPNNPAVDFITIGNVTTPSPEEEKKKKNKCKMYEGRWVYKPLHNPMYQDHDCPFLEEKMSCRSNGRPDSAYQGWSWESEDCRIPRFDGKDMLERLRGKRVILVGDSLNRNQWESLACLIYTSIPDPINRALVDAEGATYKLLRAKDYNLTLEFYWAPFLVELDENHKSGKKVLSLEKLQGASEEWRGADVMLFNTGHWWTHNGKLKSWDVFEYAGEQSAEMETETAYARGLTTWAHWVTHNVDPTKTKVYFRSISPEHQKTNQWCYNATRPMPADSYVQSYPRSMVDVTEGKIREINAAGGIQVAYLNITKMSSHRVDAHPSIYRYKNGEESAKGMSTEMLAQRADCSHWCLPGMPDTWNRVFYASLFFDGLSSGEV